ncbi:MAG: hypothetical protein IT444_07320 [Phycisphaeraceae bacterium]|nr:hypothetical protein [Phycisphaeraceae bacterium]
MMPHILIAAILAALGCHEPRQCATAFDPEFFTQRFTVHNTFVPVGRR